MHPLSHSSRWPVPAAIRGRYSGSSCIFFSSGSTRCRQRRGIGKNRCRSIEQSKRNSRRKQRWRARQSHHHNGNAENGIRIMAPTVTGAQRILPQLSKGAQVEGNGEGQWGDLRMSGYREGGWWPGRIEICKAAGAESGIDCPRWKAVDGGSEFATSDFPLLLSVYVLCLCVVTWSRLHSR